MLRFGLVLLLATSAIAAPGFSNSYDYTNLILKENAGVAKNIGAANHLTDKMFSYLDGGDSNVFILTLQELINEMATKPDSYSQAMALSQGLTTTLALATGVPGNACKAAALNDAYPTRNYRQALVRFINHIGDNLNLLSKLTSNTQAARFATGPTFTCQGSGRVYNFEGAWNAILDNASESNAALLNEQYCTVKRLYCAFNVRSNNVGTVVTASSLPPVVKAVQQAYPYLVNFLNAVAANRNVESALGEARQALAQAAQRV